VLSLKEATKIANNPNLIRDLELRVEQLGRDLLQHLNVDLTGTDGQIYQAVEARFTNNYHSPERRSAHHAATAYIDGRRELERIYEHKAGVREDFLDNDLRVGSKVVWPATTGSSGCYMRRGVVEAIHPNGGIKVRSDVGRWGGDPSCVTVTTNAQYVTVIDSLV
jgi:hypothetical protein